MRKTLIDTYESKRECDRMWSEYAQMLRNLGKTPECRVRREKRRGTWRLLLIEKESGDE